MAARKEPEKNEPETLIDMFTRLGREMRMPGLDVEKIVDHHRKNLEALQQSATKFSTGASDVLNRQREMLAETVREINDLAQNYKAPTSPQEMVIQQTEFARKAFDTALKNATEMGDLVRRSSDETMNVLRSRIKEGMEEIRQAYEQRK